MIISHIRDRKLIDQGIVMVPDSSEATPLPRTRKLPTQQRSRERVERILGAASTLIKRNGSDGMRMSEVADIAGIPIGSLYQYFPDKGSIIRTLAERFNEIGRECVAEGFDAVHSVADLRESLGCLMDAYYQMYLDDPVIVDIYSGTRTDHSLKDLEIDDTRQNAALMLNALKRIWPERDESTLRTSSLLFMELGTAAVRLALSVSGTEGDALITEFKRFVDAQYALEDSTLVDFDRSGNLLD